MTKSVSFWVSEDELVFLSNAVGEAWVAVRANATKFKARTLITYERASEVRNVLQGTSREPEQSPSEITSDKREEKTRHVSVGFDDLRFLCVATGITLDEVEEWEFQTRTGITPEEARTLLYWLRATLDAAEKE